MLTIFRTNLFSNFVSTGLNFFTLRQHICSAFYKRINQNFDLAICTFNEMDFGRFGIQYIHYPMFPMRSQRARLIVGHPNSFAKALYRFLSRSLFGFSEQSVKSNSTVTNSHWTANVVNQVYGIDSQVIYPPVPNDFAPIPWAEKVNGFICVGRFVGDKRLEQAISIIEDVRSRGHAVPLHIVGGSADPAYLKKIYRLRRDRESWIFIDIGLSRADYCHTLARYRYALHVRRNEQFGIAVAEMLKAGAIPFVPDEGGQTEIVDRHPSLIFCDPKDAAEKIDRVLCSSYKQHELKNFVHNQAGAFEIRAFIEAVEALAREARAHATARPAR